MTQIDTNGDGAITFEEFLVLITSAVTLVVSGMDGDHGRLCNSIRDEYDIW